MRFIRLTTVQWKLVLLCKPPALHESMSFCANILDKVPGGLLGNRLILLVLELKLGIVRLHCSVCALLPLSASYPIMALVGFRAQHHCLGTWSW